jgi:hypothetical protein
MQIGYKAPLQNAINDLNSLIFSVQLSGHSIILLIDANQSHDECLSNGKVKPFTIKWLKQSRELEDPFVSLTGRPNSKTTNPNRDVDFI